MNISAILIHKKGIFIYLAVLLFVTSIAGVSIYIKSKAQKTTLTQATLTPSIQPESSPNLSSDIPTAPVPSADPNTTGVLLLGYGGAGHDGGYLTDAIQLLYTDFAKEKLILISIPRDLWVKFPSGTEGKINAALVNSANRNQNLFASGSIGLKKLITEITGLRADYYVAVDFVGLQRAIGINLKGIEVNVSEILDDPWYPITGEAVNTCGKTAEEVTELSKKYSGFELEKQFPCRYKHLHFEKGINKMQGGEALEYVRSRHGSGDGDIARGRRQQEVVQAIGKKLFSINALDNISGFFSTVAKNIQTDLSPKIIEFFAPNITKSQQFKVIKINLSTTNVLSVGTGPGGASIILPKDGMFQWDGIRMYIKEQIGN